jgi:hypothetical protein
MSLPGACVMSVIACGGPSHVGPIEERPLEQPTAVDIIQQLLTEKGHASERFVQVILPNGREWTVDVAGTRLGVAFEFLTEADRERFGDAAAIPATPDETPRVSIVRRASPGGNVERLYLRVFTDRHFRYQPNPPPDLPTAPYTIREVQARLRRDVADFVAWFVTNQGSEGVP